MNEIELLKQKVEILENLFFSLYKSDRYVFEKKIQLLDGRNVQLGNTTGTKIGTTTTEKLGFFGKTPIIQVSAISAPSGGATQDAEARTAINSIRTALTNLGLTA